MTKINKQLINKEDQPKPSVYMEQPQMEDVRTTISLCTMQDGAFVTIKQENNQNVYFAGISKGSSVINRMIGMDYSDITELLIRAVNNRTKQRNFFRLQNSMLEGLITEEDFYKTIEENESDYVIEEIEEPTKRRLYCAMYLCQSIMDIKNSEDLSTLFSFSSETTDKVLKLIEADGSL